MVYELPSPTAVSLNGGGSSNGDVPPNLTGQKSSSAPHLIKSTQTLPRTKFDGLEVRVVFERYTFIRFYFVRLDSHGPLVNNLNLRL